MTSPPVVVVGSLHYDIFVRAPHRPAAGETVTGQSWAPKFGGKGGNQAVALTASGAEVRLVSAVGSDDFGKYLLAYLRLTGIDTARVDVLADAPSGISVAIADASGDYGAVIVSGANLQISEAALSDDSLWRDAAFLVLQNEVPDAVNLSAAREATARGIPICLNAAPWRPLGDDILDALDLLVLNAIEAEAMHGEGIDTLADARAACAEIGGRLPSVVVTAGRDGVAWHTDGRTGTVPGRRVDTVSTHGAGDHFIGTLIADLARGRDLECAARSANASAAAFVSRKTP